MQIHFDRSSSAIKASRGQSLCGSLRKGSLKAMTSRRSILKEDTRYRVLRLLQGNPEMSQRELAEAVDISVGGIHYLLNALVEKGYVKLANFTAAQDKRRYAYVLTPKGIAEKTAITRHFLKRKIAEYEALTAEIAALRSEVVGETQKAPSRG